MKVWGAHRTKEKDEVSSVRNQRFRGPLGVQVAGSNDNLFRKQLSRRIHSNGFHP